MYVNRDNAKFRKMMESYPHLAEYSDPMKKMERPLIGREREMRAMRAAFERPELSNVVLLGPAGSGKALDDDTLIPVADERGYVRIGDIAVGDMVFDECGRPVPVQGVFHQGMRHAYEVVFEAGSTITCNDEHLWLVRTQKMHKTRSPHVVRTLREMIDYGITKGADDHSCWYVPSSGAVERDDVELGVDPYVVGALIGDGCLTERHVLAMSSDDEDVVAEVARRLGCPGYSRVNKGNYSWVFDRGDMEVDRVVRSDTKYVQLADLSCMEDLSGVIGVKSVERRIPRQYMLGSVRQRMDLLRGLMDTDGCVTCGYRANVSFSTSCEGLADDVRELAASLGMRTRLRKSERIGSGRMEYSVYFMVPVEMRSELFLLERHRESVGKYHEHSRKFHRRYDDVAIREVRDLGVEVSMTCITVGSEHHVYLAGKEHIVTHNTALVQGVMNKDRHRMYLEVDLSRMIAGLNDPSELGDKLKRVFADATKFSEREKYGLVLFMDEFHQIVQLSPAAVEALKPLLADSGTRGIHVVAATTLEEFNQYISSNQPLVERLQRISLHSADMEMTVEILKSMAERYGVADEIVGNGLYENIYELTNRHIPANAQPRKSILMLDAMVGWHRAEHRKMNMSLLADVMYDSEGVNIAFRVDPQSIKSRLDEKVLAQSLATTSIAKRMQLCVAGLNDPTKPQSTLLFCGPTGVGKLIANSTPVPAVSPENGSLIYINHGDLRPGDVVFDRQGQPTRVLGTFPHSDVPMYRVTLTDGRSLDVGDNHLWVVYTAKVRRKVENEGKYREPRIMTTQEIFDAGVVSTYSGDSRRHLKWFIPMNGAVDTAPVDYVVDPYVVGAFIGNGALTMSTLTLSSEDVETVDEVARLIHASGYRVCEKGNYSWSFVFDEDTAAHFGSRWMECQCNARRFVQTKTLFGDMPELFGVKSGERRIPAAYMAGSIEQRWALVQGLFDTDGTVSKDDRVNIVYSTFSKGLAEDVVQLLYSLGISSKCNTYYREREGDDGSVRKMVEYRVIIRCAAEDKPKFFRLPRKLKRADRAVSIQTTRKRVKKFGMVGIADIEPIGVQDAQCIYVDNEEHLYQAGQFVVTHNTEVTKQLSKILFGDASRSLVRIDMTEFANPDSLERFRLEITSRVWENPYCIILLDEVEKASDVVTRLLLQVLDDGRLSDRNGREVSFVNCYIIMTTNAGHEIYNTIAQYEADDTGSGEKLRDYERTIRRSLVGTTGGRFPPELVGRIDTIVPFQPLSRNTMTEIVKMRLRELAQKLYEQRNIKLNVQQRVVNYIIEDTLTTETDEGGARAIMSKLESEVVTALAEFINAFPEEREIVVTITGRLAHEDVTSRTSDASVIIKSKSKEQGL